MDYSKIDEALLPFHQQLIELTQFEEEIVDEERGVKMTLDEVEINMPVQFEIIVNEDGSVTLGSSPPLYYVDTTIQPVYHQLTINTVYSNNNSNL